MRGSFSRGAFGVQSARRERDRIGAYLFRFRLSAKLAKRGAVRMFDHIKADLAQARAANHKSMSGPGAWIWSLFHLGTSAVIVYRFGNWVWRLRIPILRELLLGLYFVLKFVNQMATGVNIPVSAEIGPGLVVHTWSGVYLPNCRIGRNAYFQHGVVVNYRCKGIGDDVYFGPGAKVIREVRIGDRVRIGANAVVTRDLPDDCTAVGVPARIVCKKSTN